MFPIIISQQGQIPDDKADDLNDNGFIVLEVQDIDKVRLMVMPDQPATERAEPFDASEIGMGIAWAGLWIGIGIALAAGAVKLL